MAEGRIWHMKTRRRRIVRNLLIELIIYGILLIIYFLTVLRFLGEPLTNLFHQDPWVYAGASLILIVAQAVALEWVTSFLIDRLKLEQSE